ncbi:MAG: SEC-C metal-binding domain-containing protein, partial [Pseudomonadales bacterium]|nr:SEC-C metal-binding domain-containing protein [Pseudomonadales bacterium]
YDDVSNDQRQVIYQQRRDLMASDDISETLAGLREEVVVDLVQQYIPPQSIEEQWDPEGLQQALATELASEQPIQQWLDAEDDLEEEELVNRVLTKVEEEYQGKESEWTNVGVDMRVVEKQIMLQILDQRWKEHLATMDHLRQGIHLRAYAQKQPKQEYKRESFELFQELLYNIKFDVVKMLSRIQIERPEEVEAEERRRRTEAQAKMNFQHADASALREGGDERPSPDESLKAETFVRGERKVGRNEPCPCGSGKKYKQCHGKAA